MRMNIYVPDELRRRMDAADEPVNWSAVACQAFDVKLGEIAQRRVQRQEAIMDDVVERLRASKRKADSADFRAGCDDGREWAKRRGEADELERLSQLDIESAQAEAQYQEIAVHADGLEPGQVAACKVVDAVLDEHATGVGSAEYDEFWGVAGGFEQFQHPTLAYVQGFARGATDVWNEVKEHF